MSRWQQIPFAILLVLAISILNFVRADPDTQLKSSWQATSVTPFWLESASWGPAQGLGADFAILKVFSIYYDATRLNNNNPSVWDAMYRTLIRAQRLDPEFTDTYHMGVITLAYDAKMPKEAIKLSELGSIATPDNWQIPFVGGFIAYDVLQDYHKSAELMSRAARSPNAPPLAIKLAGRFIAKDSGKADGIVFLQSMLKVLPEQYHAGILMRIEELSSEEAP